MTDELEEATGVTTAEEALGALAAHLFVGRTRELAIFDAWLHANTDLPSILNVSGPGGVGKTELLRAFQRHAELRGQRTILVDGRTLRPTPDDLLHALGGGSLDAVVADLNSRRPLLLIDTAEDLGDLTGYLHQELLPRLDVRVRTVIAGRYPLSQVWLRAGHWRSLMQPLILEGLSADEARAFLSRRGLTDAALVEGIRRAAGGYPLALSLASDLAMYHRVRNFAVAPQWRLAVRTLAEQLVSDLDPETRELLEACAIARQFDQSLLEAMTGRQRMDAAFGRLCGLSIVRPGSNGLMLHEDVRRALSDDLRWRHPERYAELRLRALSAYRDRMQDARPAERRWLVAERLSLWEDAFIQRFLFASEEPGQVWLEPARPEDHADVLRLEMTYHNEIIPTMGTVAYPTGYSAEVHEAFFAPLVDWPGRHLTMARDLDGKAIGFGLGLPLYDRTVALLLDHPILSPVLRAHLSPAEMAGLPRAPEGATRYFFVQAAHVGVLPEATLAALFRDILATLALGGVHYVMAAQPVHRSLFASLGFEQIPGAEALNWLAEHPLLYGYVLDLRQIGFESWIEAIVAGRRPPRTLGHDELRAALKAALREWRDDAALATSPLLESVLVSRAGVAHPGPDDLRRVITEALAAALADASAQDRLALLALDLAYLQPSVSATDAAARLAVSRATLYRLLERGIDALVAALLRPTSQ